MFVEFSFKREFDSLMMHLRSKYGEELFNVDGIGEQLDINTFAKRFFRNEGSTADVSVDSNANVAQKDVVAFNAEFPKAIQKLNSYYLLWKNMKELYGLEAANNIIEAQITGAIYINDATDVGRPYCFNFSCMDIAMSGLPMIDKVKCSPPKFLFSFKSQLEQFLTIASNNILGATGLADILIVMSHYVDRILENNRDAHFRFSSQDDVWKYVRETIVSFIYTVNQPMRGGLQCVTEDTEVLTPDGFKTYDMLKAGDDIYTWKDGALNVQQVQRVNIGQHDGPMHAYRGRDCEQVVTPNHKILRRNGSGIWVLTDSSLLIDAKTPLTMPVAMLENTMPDYDISDDMLEFLVMILTDGSIEGNRLRFCKSKGRYGAARFEELCRSLGLEYSKSEVVSEWGSHTDVYRVNSSFGASIVKLLGGDKKSLPTFFKSLSRRQANIVLDTWAKFDGHASRGKIRLQCDSYEIANELQHVCFLACKGSRIVERLIGSNKTATIYLYAYDRAAKTAKDKEIIDYKGVVWCPSTEDGVVVYRKGGRIFISGNSPFTNISVYDEVFLQNMVSGYVFGDYGSPNIKTVQRLQRIYLDAMNKEMERTPLTFPVTTACISVDKEGNVQDESFVKFIARKNQQWGFINIYCGPTSTLSSCCFDGKQKTLTRSSDGVKLLTFKELHEGVWDECKRNLTIFHNGNWVKGRVIKVDGKAVYRVTTVNNKELLVTNDHINCTLRGDVETTKLTTDDYLMFSSLPLCGMSKSGLGYNEGYIVGAYLGDGSFDKDNGIILSLNEVKVEAIKPKLMAVIEKYGFNDSISEGEKGELRSLRVYDRRLVDFIKQWVKGRNCVDKSINMDCLCESEEFRRGIIDGMYVTDGGNSNRIYTTSDHIRDGLEAILTSLGMHSIIDTSDRTNEPVVIRGESFTRNHPIHCIRWYARGHKRDVSDLRVVRNNSVYFKIKSIELVSSPEYVYCFEVKNEDEPYFTLPNGIITHNCRLRSDISKEYVNSFGAGSTKIGSLGVVTLNLPRIAKLALQVQDWKVALPPLLESFVRSAAAVNMAKRMVISERIELRSLPLYHHGFMSLRHQYLTTGITGLAEMIQILGIDPLSKEGVDLEEHIIDIINSVIDSLSNESEMKENGIMFNLEQVPKI